MDQIEGQMTLDEWISIKESLKKDLIGVQESFVRIGYKLRKIEEEKLYERDGYESIAEFAAAEYHLSASTVSRFIAINKKYSIDGYSDELRPEFAMIGSSKLSEMLALPDEDLQMIRPETTREQIRELKNFEKQEPECGEADDWQQLVESFFEDNPSLLNEIYTSEALEKRNFKKLAELVNPGGTRIYKKGMFFLMMYEDNLKLKKFGGGVEILAWDGFFETMSAIFAPAGDQTWQQHFGKSEEIEENEVEKPAKPEITSSEEKSKDAGNESGNEGTGSEGDTGRDFENRGSEDDREEEKSTDSDDADSAEKPRGTEKTGEIAPAQTPESLKRQIPEPIQEEEKKAATHEEQKEDFMPFPEAEEKPEITRKQYLDGLTAQEAAAYLIQEYLNDTLTEDMFHSHYELWRWLETDVNEFGEKQQ